MLFHHKGTKETKSMWTFVSFVPLWCKPARQALAGECSMCAKYVHTNIIAEGNLIEIQSWSH
jgi:hypothetical protein